MMTKEEKIKILIDLKRKYPIAEVGVNMAIERINSRHRRKSESNQGILLQEDIDLGSNHSDILFVRD